MVRLLKIIAFIDLFLPDRENYDKQGLYFTCITYLSLVKDNQLNVYSCLPSIYMYVLLYDL